MALRPATALLLTRASLVSEIAASVENMTMEDGVLVYDVGAKRVLVEITVFDITGAEEQA